MMKEEREAIAKLRYYRTSLPKHGSWDEKICVREDRKVIRTLVKAVREDCARVADSHAKGFAEFATRAAKKGHNVDDIVARRIASEDIATAIRRKGK